MTKTFRLTESHRATQDGNFGAVRTVTIETLTERDGGLQVDAHIAGHVEGTRIDRKSSHFYPGVTLEKATAYRLRHGYTEVL